MRAILKDDLVLGFGEGDIAGPEVPAALVGVPAARLRFVGGQLVDVSGRTEWWLDDAGFLRAVQADPTWPPVICAWDAETVHDGAAWRLKSAAETLTPRIKAECRRRIFDEVNETAQINLAAAAGGGLLDADDLTAYRSGLVWIADMRERCQTLIVAANPNYRDDGEWPAIPTDAAALASRF